MTAVINKTCQKEISPLLDVFSDINSPVQTGKASSLHLDNNSIYIADSN